MANENLTVASAAVIIDELLTMAMRPSEPYEPAAREAALQNARDFLIAYAAEHGIKAPRSTSLRAGVQS